MTIKIRETSVIMKSMKRARDDCLCGIQEVTLYHRRQIQILQENRCIGCGEPDKKIFSRPVMELRRQMLEDIEHELLHNAQIVTDEILSIDISLGDRIIEGVDTLTKKDVYSDNEDIIYTQRDRTLPVSQKRR